MPFWKHNGKLVTMDGKGILCPECPCECKPYTIAEYITNGIDPERATWDLTPYQGKHKAKVRKGAKWRLIELSAHLSHGVGDVSEDGEMLGLPASFTSRYIYDGYMALQVGCYDEDRNETTWPEDSF